MINECVQFVVEAMKKQSGTVISVDVQPEYFTAHGFDKNFLSKYVKYINKQNSVVFLYNGADTLGMVSESDYQMWLFDNGVSEDVINSSEFYDKGYAFFRYCIDSGIYEDDVVDLVKFMAKNNINDSRDIGEHWDEFIKEHGHHHLRELLEFSEDCIHIPDLMDYLRPFNNIILLGGARGQCLKEVEIALKSLGKQHSFFESLIYENETIKKIVD